MFNKDMKIKVVVTKELCDPYDDPDDYTLYADLYINNTEIFSDNFEGDDEKVELIKKFALLYGSLEEDLGV